ncbi:DNA-dependent RNA polymerase II [Marasmius sp. AFHP31]|nr:DNA-dependent RNA polymerase II [Marasmius sp. AFHP31]
MQELVVENSEPILDQAQQFSEKQTDSSRRYEIKFGQIYLSRPTVAEADGLVVPVFPQEARLRTLTYIEMQKRVLCGHEEGGEMVWETENDSGAEGTKVPIVLRSTFCILRGLQDQDLFDECLYDSRGYFIINGSGKVLIAQERMATNRAYVFAKAQPSPTNFLAELHNAIEKARKTIAWKLGPYSVPSVSLPTATSSSTPATTCKDIQMLEMLKPFIDDGFVIQDRKVALDFIGNRGDPTRDVAPCFPSEGSESKKAYFFGYMIHRLLLTALERRELDDRDHFGKQRLDLAGPLLANLFRMLFRKRTKDVYRYMQKTHKEFNLALAVKHQTITNGLRYSLATGNWGDQKKFMSSKAGVSTDIPTPRRSLICVGVTPRWVVEERSQSRVSSTILIGGWCAPPKRQKDELVVLGQVGVGVVGGERAFEVFVNGVWIGVHWDPANLVKAIKKLRRKDDIGPKVSVVRDIRERELRLYTDAGRVCRPLFIVENQQLLPQKKHVRWIANGQNDEGAEYKWEQLVKGGIVELLDAEEETVMISMTPEDLENSRLQSQGIDPHANDGEFHPAARLKAGINAHTWTHCEIHPSMILGICASIIPFSDHNQSPRNTYQPAMGKQAMGIFLANFLIRMDTMANILYYPQKPLATTRSMECLNFREPPTGQNAVVDILCYSCYDQEDSVIMSQSSIDRGLFPSIYYQSYMDLEKKSGVQQLEEFEKPLRENTLLMKHGTYDKLEDDGLIAPGTGVRGEDIIIGKTAPIPPDSEELPANADTFEERFLITTNSEGQKFVKVRVRSTRIPQIEDKSASRHGQKGTIGITYRQEDMPFTAEGITPDLIINPHAIPSRMTIEHLVECLLSKVATLIGNEGATPFTDLTVESVSIFLRQKGYQSRGLEVMYHGHTGRKLQAQVYLGPTYYQRLKHMVDDKIHSRARGPV